MKTAGVRELQSRPSEPLRLVRNGEENLVTDRPDLYPSPGPVTRAGRPARRVDEERGER